jgi:hypothetical protein
LREEAVRRLMQQEPKRSQWNLLILINKEVHPPDCTAAFRVLGGVDDRVSTVSPQLTRLLLPQLEAIPASQFLVLSMKGLVPPGERIRANATQLLLKMAAHDPGKLEEIVDAFARALKARYFPVDSFAALVELSTMHGGRAQAHVAATIVDQIGAYLREDGDDGLKEAQPFVLSTVLPHLMGAAARLRGNEVVNQKLSGVCEAAGRLDYEFLYNQGLLTRPEERDSLLAMLRVLFFVLVKPEEGDPALEPAVAVLKLYERIERGRLDVRRGGKHDDRVPVRVLVTPTVVLGLLDDFRSLPDDQDSEGARDRSRGTPAVLRGAV